MLVGVLLVSLTMAVMAEEEEDEGEGISKFIKRERINAAYVMFGGTNLDFSKLNSYFGRNQLPVLNEGYLSFGLGGHVIFSKWILGLEVVRTIRDTPSIINTYSTSGEAKYTVLNFGYLLKSDNGLMYYPYIGFGIGAVKVTITKGDIDSFDDITHFQSINTVQRSSFLINAGFALDYFHKYVQKTKGKNNLVLGIRAGYMFAPGMGKWKINYFHVPDGPSTGVSGPYIFLTVGLGGWIQKFIKKTIYE